MTQDQHTESARPPAYFGTLAPQDCEITWNGHQNTVRLRVLEFGEELNCSRYARQLVEGQVGTDEYVLAEALDRLARALVAVDGQLVAENFPTVESRRQWVATFPGTLIDAMSTAYVRMRATPLAFLEENLSDPNSGGGPSHSGEPHEGAIPPP